MPYYRHKPILVEAKRLLDLEQDAALPGGWLLTFANGTNIVIPDENFRSTFEPVNGEAAKYMLKTEQLLPPRDILPFPGVEEAKVEPALTPRRRSILRKMLRLS